jgi:hypothetical protein
LKKVIDLTPSTDRREVDLLIDYENLNCEFAGEALAEELPWWTYD